LGAGRHTALERNGATEAVAQVRKVVERFGGLLTASEFIHLGLVEYRQVGFHFFERAFLAFLILWVLIFFFLVEKDHKTNTVFDSDKGTAFLPKRKQADVNLSRKPNKRPKLPFLYSDVQKLFRFKKKLYPSEGNLRVEMSTVRHFDGIHGSKT
jgi:hypothetical protein